MLVHGASSFDIKTNFTFNLVPFFSTVIQIRGPKHCHLFRHVNLGYPTLTSNSGYSVSSRRFVAYKFSLVVKIQRRIRVITIYSSSFSERRKWFVTEFLIFECLWFDYLWSLLLLHGQRRLVPKKITSSYFLFHLGALSALFSQSMAYLRCQNPPSHLYRSLCRWIRSIYLQPCSLKCSNLPQSSDWLQ